MIWMHHLCITVACNLLKLSVNQVIERVSASLETRRFPSKFVDGESKTLPPAEVQNLLGLPGLPGFEK
jgi:hypothetical protein